MDTKEAFQKNISQLIFWLHEGPNSFGSHPRNALVFPEPVAQFAGILFLKNSSVLIRASQSANITHEKKPIDNEVIYQAGKSLVLEVGAFSFHVFDEEGKIGIQLKPLKG